MVCLAVRFKKFLLSSQHGSAPVDFVLLVGPTIAVCGLLVTAAAYISSSAMVRLETLQLARQASSADFLGFDVAVDVTRVSQDGVPFVRVAKSHDLSLLGMAGRVHDLQILPAQSSG